VAAQREVPSATARQIGQRQALFRDVNERIEEIAGRLNFGEPISILCECASTDCNERIDVSQEVYERLRRMPTHFAVLAGHEVPSAERVVEVHQGFVTVEKFGDSAVVAVKLDPRGRRRAS
jgi:hypothetical protein